MSLSARHQDKTLIFRIAELFFNEQLSPSVIASKISHEFQIHFTHTEVTRLLKHSGELGLVRLIPPVEETLARDLAKMFGLNPKRITVVNVGGNYQRSRDNVAAKAAEVAIQCMRELKPVMTRPLGLGLGPGRATLEFSHHLSSMLRLEDHDAVAKLKLFAITAGCPISSPEFAPISFFNLYPSNHVVERVGLFAETVLPAEEFQSKISTTIGLKEAYEQRDDIDIIITAMGSRDDKHDQFRQFMEQSRGTVSLNKKPWVGNVQYRPYTNTAPILDVGSALRPATLFELADFQAISRQDKRHVILMVCRCGVCGNTRVNAVRPLLKASKLRIWNHLVIDVAIVRELLSEN